MERAGKREKNRELRTLFLALSPVILQFHILPDRGTRKRAGVKSSPWLRGLSKPRSKDLSNEKREEQRKMKIKIAEESPCSGELSDQKNVSWREITFIGCFLFLAFASFFEFFYLRIQGTKKHGTTRKLFFWLLR